MTFDLSPAERAQGDQNMAAAESNAAILWGHYNTHLQATGDKLYALHMAVTHSMAVISTQTVPVPEIMSEPLYKALYQALTTVVVGVEWARRVSVEAVQERITELQSRIDVADARIDEYESTRDGSDAGT